jgi:hypothetical protein
MYVNNNPYKYNDPNGEFLNHIVGALASAALKVAIQVVTTGEFQVWVPLYLCLAQVYIQVIKVHETLVNGKALFIVKAK